MNQPAALSRRHLLHLGGLAGVGLSCAIAAPAAAKSAFPRVTVTDLGPGVQTLTMFATAMVGDTVYVSTRNVEPMKVIGYDVVTGSVTSVTDVFGESTQALYPEPTGRYLYGCVRTNFGDNTTPESQLFRIELTAPGRPVERLGDPIIGLIPHAMHVAPDGVVFMTGRELDPKVYEYTPETGALRVLATPDPTAQYGRSILATETTVYYGLRGVNPTTGATAAGLYQIDRATGSFASILPRELATTSEIRDMTLDGGSLVAVNGSIGAILQVANPASYRVLRPGLNMGRLPVSFRGLIYTAGLLGLVEIDPTTLKGRLVPGTGVDGSITGLFVHGDELVITTAFGMVFQVDPATASSTPHDLVEAGAPVGTQLAMSIAVGPGVIYVGGTNAVGRHAPDGTALPNIYAPGEAKDIIVLDGKAYTGQYSGVGIMGYDPTADDRFLRLLSPLPAGQNRPHDLLWDADRRRICVGSGSDGNFFGTLSIFDPATSTVVASYNNPFGDNQQVRCLARDGSTLFLGGELAGGSQVMAWDLDAQRELWRVSLNPAPRAVCGLAVRGQHLYVMGHSGGLHVVDLGTRTVIHSVVRPDLVPDWGSLTTHMGRVHGVSGAALFRFDPKTFEPHVLVDGLGAEWYGVPRVAVDEQGDFYGIKGRNLVRIQVSG
jgi:hypothetical protein